MRVCSLLTATAYKFEIECSIVSQETTKDPNIDRNCIVHLYQYKGGVYSPYR